MHTHGFTLVELLLVLALTFVVGAFTFPMGITFFRAQLLSDTTDLLSDTLRTAQVQAHMQKNDSSFGVKALAGSFVLFEGESYEARTVAEDESFTLPPTVELSGFDQIIFSKGTGIPDSTHQITLSLVGNEQIITVNATGVIGQ